MVLVNAFRYLILPNPAASDLVTVATLVYENVSTFEGKILDFLVGCFNLLNRRQIEKASLDVCYPKICYRSHSSCEGPLAVLREAPFENSDFVEARQAC